MATRKKTSQPKAKEAPPMAGQDGVGFDQIKDVQVTFTMRLGHTTETLDRVVEYTEQSLIELDRRVDEPVDVLVNGRLFARGEVVTVNENFGVRITQIVRPVT